MRKSRLSHYRQARLSAHFISGSTASTAAGLCGVKRKTGAYFLLRLGEMIGGELVACSEAVFGDEIEVRHSGIHPFCITIDTEAEDYLPHMYGHASYVVVDEVKKLPLKVADIYRKLTT